MFDRIKNLMGAMVNNSVNKMETPEILLEQAEMELQTNLKKIKEALTESMASEKMMEKQLQAKAQEVTDWEKRAAVGVQHGNDAVASECLKKKLDANQAAQTLHTQLEQQKVTTATLKERYSEIDEKLKDFMRKKSEMMARAKAGETLAKANELVSGTGSSSMDKWEEKIRAKELQADPLGTGATDQKFKALDQHDELDSELAALKAQLGVAKAEESVPLVEVVKPKTDSEDDKK